MLLEPGPARVLPGVTGDALDLELTMAGEPGTRVELRLRDGAAARPVALRLDPHAGTATLDRTLLGTGEGGGGDHLREHLDGVVLNHAQVADALALDELEQVADARRVHLDGQKIAVGPGLRDGGSGLAHTEADLQHHRRMAAEQGGQIQAARRERHAVARQEILDGARLCVGDAPLTQDEAAHRTVTIGTWRVGLGQWQAALGREIVLHRLGRGACGVVACGRWRDRPRVAHGGVQRPISPVVGELGLAV